MITVVGLVAGTIAAIALTQDRRREGTVISAVSTDPRLARSCPPAERGGGRIRISFFLNRDDTVALAIVNGEDGGHVRTLAGRRRLQGNRRHCALWDARDDGGRRVPAGTYRLRVSLERADRIATAGEPIRVPAPPASVE